MARPEARARTIIDHALKEAGWVVQDEDEMNLAAAHGVAVREVRMAKGYGQADYLLFVDREAVGALEAKKKGHTLSGVEGQVQKYSLGLPAYLETRVTPLPFQYLSTGTETLFVNGLDPRPRSRQVFAPHRPETLADWLRAASLERWVQEIRPLADDEVREPPVDPYDSRPASLRGRLAAIPPTRIAGLWDNQQRAINGLETSLGEDRPRALVQMATGSGKSLTAVVEAYRLIKLGGARRILFLVDRGNLGSQAQGEFETYRTEVFSEREHVPKTLIFAKDDSHAEDIVTTMREEFGESNAFCSKITYKSTGSKPEDLIQDFRTGFYPRIAVTVDMIATGTDVKPIEVVLFLRSVKSRVLYEQMKGRGSRVISAQVSKKGGPRKRSKSA